MESSVSSLKKIKIISFIYLIAFCVIIFRLIYLQVYLNQELFNRAQNNFLRTEKVNSRRGNILDCHGRLLATNQPITNIYWRGTGNRTLSSEQRTLLEHISHLINVELDQTVMNNIKFVERTSKETLLCSNASFEQLSKLTELFPDNPNISISTQLKRCYPHSSKASHVIGYISTIDERMTGKMGIEKMFEPTLRGQEGMMIKTINSLGTNLYAQEITKALAGQDIVTTLDLGLQDLAEEAFPENQSGCLLIMDPQTGAILSAVSRPAFDPSLFLETISLNQWQSLQAKQPFLNRMLCCYPPASPFKLVTLSAALENKIITPETITYCKGFTRFRGRRYHCADHDGHGRLDIQESVEKSCNILFFEIAKRISIDTLAEYAHKFGLGQSTNIMFPEQTGLVPTTEWKRRVKGEPWWPGENLSAVIGQSYLLVTPLQIARMIGSIFTGYLVTPRVIMQEPICTQPLSIKPETRAFLKKTMKGVVEQGTAQRVNKIKNLKVYAKTGTAQTISLEKQEAGGNVSHYLEHAWFTAFFRYKKSNPLIMVLLIENVGSSKEATKVAKKFLVNYRSMQDQQESQTIN